jgi:hypothetical protein
VVVDGGSSSEFLDRLREIGVEPIEQKEGGMSASRRQVFNEASSLEGAEVICWTEPEKVDIINHLQQAATPVLEGEADIVVPARTEAGFDSLPPAQAKSEKKYNRLYNKVLRSTGLLEKSEPDLDSYFGPRIFKNDPQILNIFTRKYKLKEASRLEGIVKTESYSNTTFFPLMIALEKGLKVKSVPIEYRHPEEQTEQETGDVSFDDKRKNQGHDIVRGAIQMARYLIDNPQRPSELIEELLESE